MKQSSIISLFFCEDTTTVESFIKGESFSFKHHLLFLITLTIYKGQWIGRVRWVTSSPFSPLQTFSLWTNDEVFSSPLCHLSTDELFWNQTTYSNQPKLVSSTQERGYEPSTHWNLFTESDEPTVKYRTFILVTNGSEDVSFPHLRSPVVPTLPWWACYEYWIFTRVDGPSVLNPLVSFHLDNGEDLSFNEHKGFRFSFSLELKNYFVYWRLEIERVLMES